MDLFKDPRPLHYQPAMKRKESRHESFGAERLMKGLGPKAGTKKPFAKRTFCTGRQRASATGANTD